VRVTVETWREEHEERWRQGRVGTSRCVGCGRATTAICPASAPAAAHLGMEKNSRRTMGYRDLWMLNAALDEQPDTEK